MITAGGYTTETAVSAIEAKLADAVAFGRMFIANPESRRAIFLRRSQGIVGSATTTISGNVVRAAKFSPTLASC
jgi:2,4-dienoyl-CoA reductase-like NADH-dependent reductase (Old Yellow Enzyme family)